VCTADVGDLFSAGALNTFIPCGEEEVLLLAASFCADTVYKSEAVSQYNFCELKVAEFAVTFVVDVQCLRKTQCMVCLNVKLETQTFE